MPVARGTYQPTSVRMAEEGCIYIFNAKERLAKGDAALKKIGSFSMNMRTLPPLVDRAFKTYTK